LSARSRTLQSELRRVLINRACCASAGNRLDVSAYRCVDVAGRNRQNWLRPSSPLWPVVTRRVRPTTLNGPKGSGTCERAGSWPFTGDFNA
jgi:hypothetical protein